jgi:preprotein translocase subunit YajC
VVAAFLLLQTAPASSPIAQFLPLIMMLGIAYLLLFLPMQRQKKAQAKMLAGLKNGDMVSTTGGIIGLIVSVTDDSLVLRVKPDNVKLQVARSAVATLMSEETSK